VPTYSRVDLIRAGLCQLDAGSGEGQNMRCASSSVFGAEVGVESSAGVPGVWV